MAILKASCDVFLFFIIIIIIILSLSTIASVQHPLNQTAFFFKQLNVHMPTFLDLSTLQSLARRRRELASECVICLLQIDNFPEESFLFFGKGEFVGGIPSIVWLPFAYNLSYDLFEPFS